MGLLQHKWIMFLESPEYQKVVWNLQIVTTGALCLKLNIKKLSAKNSSATITSKWWPVLLTNCSTFGFSKAYVFHTIENCFMPSIFENTDAELISSNFSCGATIKFNNNLLPWIWKLFCKDIYWLRPNPAADRLKLRCSWPNSNGSMNYWSKMSLHVRDQGAL